jgi:pSer/pThr/pTyr-binding forkhead associated (FHA) protein
MICSACENEIKDDVNFCPNCGSSISDATISMSVVPINDEDFAYIEILKGPTQGSRYALDEKMMSIGRDGDSTIMLDDFTVSRAHAKIIQVGNEFTIEDQNSLNGVFINGGLTKSHKLLSGDKIQIGKFALIFVDKK